MARGCAPDAGCADVLRAAFGADFLSVRFMGIHCGRPAPVSQQKRSRRGARDAAAIALTPLAGALLIGGQVQPPSLKQLQAELLGHSQMLWAGSGFRPHTLPLFVSR